MNAPLPIVQTGAIPALAMDENQLIQVLETSLYPGANPTSIALVINYCRASMLDPMQKPVHIVPMWDSKRKQMRDVIMPGVGLYRTQAARSGQYAGVSDPEYGPDITEEVGGVTITYPAWCKVTVKRLLDANHIVDFSATERWRENYATAGKDSLAPNAMWKKRPYGQLAKCAEAQALRKAFPELAGSQPTADEMEGKVINDEYAGTVVDNATGEVVKEKFYPAADFDKNLPSWTSAIQNGKKTADQIIAMVSSKGKLTAEQEASIRAVKANPTQDKTQPAAQAVVDAIRLKAEEATLSEVDICKNLNVETLDGITVAQAEAAIAFIANPMGD